MLRWRRLTRGCIRNFPNGADQGGLGMKSRSGIQIPEGRSAHRGPGAKLKLKQNLKLVYNI